jgi:hypothetical protein
VTIATKRSSPARWDATEAAGGCWLPALPASKDPASRKREKDRLYFKQRLLKKRECRPVSRVIIHPKIDLSSEQSAVILSVARDLRFVPVDTTTDSSLRSE